MTNAIELRLAALEAQSRIVADKLAISEVIYRYCRSLDRLDQGLCASVFHDDASVDYGAAIYQGPIADFLPFAMQFQGAMREAQHCVTNTLIDVDGDRAFSEAYVYAYHIQEREGKAFELIVGARYLDVFTRRQGEWRIAQRTEVIDWGQERVLTDEWLVRNPGLLRGAHNQRDPLYELRARFAAGLA